MLLASQLPDNLDDAGLIVQAVTELLETFLVKGPSQVARPSNVLPFGSAG